jgi:hypothetical protein
MIDPEKIYKAYKFVKNMSNNNDKDKSKKAEKTIRNHVLWSMGAGFIPFPIADFLAVAAVQLDMIKSMSFVYDIDFNVFVYNRNVFSQDGNTSFTFEVIVVKD